MSFGWKGFTSALFCSGMCSHVDGICVKCGIEQSELCGSKECGKNSEWQRMLQTVVTQMYTYHLIVNLKTYTHLLPCSFQLG